MPYMIQLLFKMKNRSIITENMPYTEQYNSIQLDHLKNQFYLNLTIVMTIAD